MSWQDIDTAPLGSGQFLRTGAPMVLLTDGEGIYMGFWNGRSWDDGDFQNELGIMTHWMPLPPLPAKPAALDLDQANYRSARSNA